MEVLEWFELAMNCKKCGNNSLVAHAEGQYCTLCGKLHPQDTVKIEAHIGAMPKAYITTAKFKRTIEDPVAATWKRRAHKAEDKVYQLQDELEEAIRHYEAKINAMAEQYDDLRKEKQELEKKLGANNEDRNRFC